MVNDDALAIHASESVTFVISHLTVAETETHEADDHIGCGDHKRIVGDTYTITGGGLSGNSHIVLVELELFLRYIVPDTSNTMVRAPLWVTA